MFSLPEGLEMGWIDDPIPRLSCDSSRPSVVWIDREVCMDMEVGGGWATVPRVCPPIGRV